MCSEKLNIFNQEVYNNFSILPRKFEAKKLNQICKIESFNAYFK